MVYFLEFLFVFLIAFIIGYNTTIRINGMTVETISFPIKYEEVKNENSKTGKISLP